MQRTRTVGQDRHGVGIQRSEFLEPVQASKKFLSMDVAAGESDYSGSQYGGLGKLVQAHGALLYSLMESRSHLHRSVGSVDCLRFTRRASLWPITSPRRSQFPRQRSDVETNRSRVRFPDSAEPAILDWPEWG